MADSLPLEALHERLDALIRPLVERDGVELVELKVGHYGKSSTVQVYVWRHALAISECADISRAIGEQLDAVDLIPNRYTLEVSTPGLTRPLVTPRDFERAIGEVVKVERKSGGTARGEILRVEGDTLVLREANPRPSKARPNPAALADPQTLTVPLDDVVRGKIELDL